MYKTFKKQLFIEENFITQLLLHKGYPNQLINKWFKLITFKDRCLHLKLTQKCTMLHRQVLPPPNYQFLQHIILKNYHSLNEFLPKPLFISLKHKTSLLILSTLNLTTPQIIPKSYEPPVYQYNYRYK